MIFIQSKKGIVNLTTLQKLKGYSNPAGGHPTFISQWNSTNCRYIGMQVMRTEECICIHYAIGFCDADIYIYISAYD